MEFPFMSKKFFINFKDKSLVLNLIKTVGENAHRRCRLNKRFAKSGNNRFDLKIYVKFVVLASGENFTLKCRLRQAVNR